MADVEKVVAREIREFDWWNYGMDEVDQLLQNGDPACQEWVDELAKRITVKVRPAGE